MEHRPQDRSCGGACLTPNGWLTLGSGQTFRLTGNVAIQASAATSTMLPSRVMTRRRRRLVEPVLMPANRVLLPKGPEESRTHYLSLIEADSEEWRVRLRFREILRSDPALRQEYQQLKRGLASEHPLDRVA